LKDLIERALNAAQLKGATYADARIVRREDESISVKNGIVQALGHGEDQGLGVRVIADGAWGFASSAALTAAEAERVAALAVSIAKASALFKMQDVDIGPPVVSRGAYRSPITTVPFSEMAFIRERKTFASTEGSWVEQEIVESGCGIEATAIGDGEVQVRSYPNSVGRHQMTRGYEFVDEMDLAGNAERVGAEADALLHADTCPGGVMTVIIGGPQLALQVHESCGHPIELDRVFGAEASFAGTSFLTTDKLGGTFRYGSPVVNITADSTTPGGLGTFGWDDEGVPAQSTSIVRKGIFMDYLMSRETARRLGKTSNGCMRASGWNRMPIIRMVNVSLEPGTWKLDDLVADTDAGIFMDVNRSWSIDDRRLNFQFGTEIAYEVKGGKLGRLLKNAIYTGITPEFWGSCDAVCNRDHWVVWGTPNCGKGQPMQSAHTGHGAAPARFRNIQVRGA
jgi:TldD protein